MAKSSKREEEVGKEEKSDGLEIVSIGSLYNGPWDKKYWSSSRGKDRYPYPVGYQARRAYNGGAYKLEIHEGPKGPSFVISTADGHSCTGQTPDIAWERLQKNFFPRSKAWNGKRFSCKIDGVEFFGFKNPFVQRLLRELMADINGIAEHSLLPSGFCNGAATTVKDNVSPNVCTHPDLLPYVESPQLKGKRSKRREIMNPKSASTAGFKRFRAGDVNCAVETSNSEHSNLEKRSSLLPYTVSSNKEHDSRKLPDASECLHPVAGEETTPLSIKVGFPLSVGCSDHLMEKDVPAIEESSLVGSENSNSTTAVCNFPAEEKLLDRSLDTKVEGLNLTMLEEDRAGDAPALKDTQSVHDIDLCAPDTLDFVQENITNSAPATQDKSTCSVKEELTSTEATVSEGLVTDSHPEEVIGSSISNGSSERSDFDSVGPDIAKSMMTFLLPQAIPLLKKNSRRKKKVLNSSTNVHGTPKPHEKNVETRPFVGGQCPDVCHSVLPGSEHTKSVVLDTFDDDQCGTHEMNQLTLPSSSAEADKPCYDVDACLPCRKEQLVNVDVKESSVCDVDSSVIKDIFCHDEVQLASSKRPQDGYLYSCESVLDSKSARQNVFSKENQNVGKNLDENWVGAKVDSGQNDSKSAPDFNDAVATSNAIQKGTGASMELSMKDISVKAETAETGNLSQEPKKVYTRKKDPKAAARTGKCNAPFLESITCRNLGHDSIPETTRTLAGSEAFQMSSSVDKPHKNDLFDGEPGVGEQLKDLHLDKASINPKPLVESLLPFTSKIKNSFCASKGKDASNLLIPSVRQVKKPQSEDMLVGNQDILNVNGPVTSPKQGTTFSCNSTYSVKEVQTNSDLKLRRTLKLDNELDGMVELLGCYFHPMPVLSLLLGTKGDEIYVCALCGPSTDKNRTLFLYKLSVEETSTGCPSFVGHTSVTFPSLTDIFGRDISLEQSGLQLTPDGQHLVLLGHIKTPYCREGRINCLCSTCSSDSFEHSSLKIVQVNTGYVSVLVKLRTVDSLLCTLICEHNHLVAAGESGRIYVWTMNSAWSSPTEEFLISANDSVSPCMVELKRIPHCASLIVGHNGFGEFTVWDISKRSFLSRYSSLSGSACQFSPIGLFNWQREVCGFSYSTVEEHINRIKDATKLWISENSENHSFHPLDGEDIAIWLLVSTVPELETQCNYVSSDSHINPVGWWRLALLVKNMLILGSELDPRAAAIGTSSGHGIIGTLDGLLYMWELTTGTKLGTLHHFKGGSVSCIATDDSRKGVISVACDTGQLLVYQHSQDSCKSMR